MTTDGLVEAGLVQVTATNGATFSSHCTEHG